MNSRAAYGGAIFAGAFLLFQIEPLIAKRILPWFGGAAAVWTVCLLFFQMALLLGYAYAHWLTSKVSSATQGRIHAAALAASLLLLPVYPGSWWAPRNTGHPALRILAMLAATVGLPYVLLSSTSPLLQRWHAGNTGASPYRLYALSNAASLLALVSYPVGVEPWLTTRHQAIAWSAAYAGFAALCVAIALSPRADANARETEPEGPPPDKRMQALWIALAACGSALLLSVTNQITQNIAAVPLLWVLPLSLYLVSFILCFGARPWYARGVFLRLLGVALAGMAFALSPSYSGLPLQVSLPLFCGGLFVACMFCHGELARLKPHPRHLTGFYLMISLGGALGAVFVALVAPHIFTGFYELQAALGACAVLAVVVHGIDAQSPYSLRRLRAGVFVLAGLAVALVASLVVSVREDAAQPWFAARNFYGELRLVDGEAAAGPNAGESPSASQSERRVLTLMNGTINHGTEFLAADRRDWPTTYYGPDSGAGVALRAARTVGSLRVGVIGLGAGTTAAYGRPGDQFTYYEINPLVIEIARRDFSFLKDSAAKIEIVEGDARLSLEREPGRRFDVLMVDAFSGDSIPVHLLTREAFELYFRHLKRGGVLAVHISNQYLDLQPVVVGAAASLGKEAVLIENSADRAKEITPAKWVLAGEPGQSEGWTDIEAAGAVLVPGAKNRMWTDDFSNLFRALK
jgi:SAM-dependent methyltransferase